MIGRNIHGDGTLAFDPFRRESYIVLMNVRNLPGLLIRQARRMGPAPAVRFSQDGRWVEVGWNEFHDRVRDAALGWIALGVEPGDRVGLLAENSFDWLVADLSIQSAGGVVVPLHAALGSGAVRRVLADCGASAAIASAAKQLDKFPPLRVIASIEPCRDALSLAGLEQRGRSSARRLSVELDRRLAGLDHNSLASILYTSGTTGDPKGVMLTHGNILFDATAMNAALGPFPPAATFFNWLPLSHAYARTVDVYLPLVAGGRMTLARSAETVAVDLSQTHPVHLSSVPRFYEKLLASVRDLPADERTRRLRAIFGPRIGWLGCGGAPLPLDVARAYEDAGFEVIVGYGLTEASPVISTNRLGANRLGTVGQALPGVEIRIADDGEILTRGPHVMAGYWNRPDAAADAIKDGWLHTGDLGRLDADGYLIVAGRKKDLIVLSSGKKVRASDIEQRLTASPVIDQAAVFGEGRSCLTAVLVPAASVIDLGEALRSECDRALADAAPWERIRRIVVADRPFDVETGELTISMKLRRDAVYQRYRAEIDGDGF